MAEYQEFPKHMAHPAYTPGSLGTEVKSPGGVPHYVGGKSARFPPVMVHNADQQEYHESQGYVAQGTTDAAAFTRAHAIAPPMSNYKPEEYPKWIGDVLVQDEDEEAALAAAPPPAVAEPPAKAE